MPKSSYFVLNKIFSGKLLLIRTKEVSMDKKSIKRIGKFYILPFGKRKKNEHP
jgi:hypothetical protein